MCTHDKVLLIKPNKEVQLSLSLHDHKCVDKRRAEVVNQLLFIQIGLPPWLRQ